MPAAQREEAAARLSQATGGNPFFVAELLNELRHLTDWPADLPLPAGVRHLIQRRLDRFSTAERMVLDALALFDRPATLDETQRISGRSEEETATAVDLAVRRNLLVERNGRYDFHHDLLRQAVEEQVTPPRRRLFCRRLALWLAEMAVGQPEGERQAVVGRITGYALTGELPHLVFTWAPQAAARAEQLHAYSDARRFLEAAINRLRRFARRL